MKTFKIHFKTTQYKSNLIQIEYYTIQIKNLTIQWMRSDMTIIAIFQCRV